MTKKDKVEKVMGEWKAGTLTSHGKKVTNYDQAVAIALSEAGLSKKYAEGGSIEKENALMVANNNKQIAHHTEEMEQALKDTDYVPAWVVAKVNRSASDLSDATHYLEGQEGKYAEGGGIKSDKMKVNITKNEFQTRKDDSSRVFHWYEGNIGDYTFTAETDSNGINGINKGSIYNLYISKVGGSNIARYDRKWEYKSRNSKDGIIISEIIEYIDSISDKKDGEPKYKDGNMNKYAKGGAVDAPKIYVADLEAYNNGKLVGEWLDLSDFEDGKDVSREISKLLKKWGAEEYAIHDVENVPSSIYSEYMGEEDFDKIIKIYKASEENDLPYEVISEIMLQYEPEDLQEWISEYYEGHFDNDTDLAYSVVESVGGVSDLGKKTTDMYFDYESFGRDLSINDEWEGDFDSDEDRAYDYVENMGGVSELGDKTIGMYFDYDKFGRDLAIDDYIEIEDGYYFRTPRYSRGGNIIERRYVNRSQNYETRYAKNRPARKGYKDERKFAVGGEIGNTVIFSRYGERTTGRVTDKLKNGYEVVTDEGTILVEPQEVISFSDEPIAKKKRFGFFAEGGEIQSKIEKLQAVVNSKMLPESVKENARKKIAELEKELHESKETKAEEKAEHKAGGTEYSEKVKMYIPEIKRMTGTSTEAVEKFIKDNDLSEDDVYKLMQGLGQKKLHHSEFVTALVGTNKDFKNNFIKAIKGETKMVHPEDSKIELRKITQQEWNAKKKHGYTSINDGVKYILTNENGATILVPVEIVKGAKATAPTRKEKVSPEDIRHKLKQGYSYSWTSAEIGYPNKIELFGFTIYDEKGKDVFKSSMIYDDLKQVKLAVDNRLSKIIPTPSKPTTRKAPIKKAAAKKVVVKKEEPKPKFKVGDVLRKKNMRGDGFDNLKILAVTGWTGNEHRYDIVFLDDNLNSKNTFAKGYDSEFSAIPKPKADHKKLVAKLKAKKGAKEYDNRASLNTETGERRKRNISSDKKRTALPLGKRVAADGSVYYENRLNRGDVSKEDKLEKGGEVKSSGWGLNLNW